MTHPSHTFFFEIWRGVGRGTNRHPAALTPPLASKLSASPPRSDCGAHTPGRAATGDPQPSPHPRRCRPAGAGGATPGKEGKRAGRGGGARAAGASSLLHCRGAIFPRLQPAGGARAGRDHRPRRAPPSRGATAPAGRELCPPCRTPARPLPAMRAHTASAARLRFPPGETPSRRPLAARLLAPSPHPTAVCHGAIRLRRARSWGRFPFPSPPAEPTPKQKRRPGSRTRAARPGAAAPGVPSRSPRRLRHLPLAAPIVRRRESGGSQEWNTPRKATLACPAAAKPTPRGRLRTDKASEKRQRVAGSPPPAASYPTYL